MLEHQIVFQFLPSIDFSVKLNLKVTLIDNFSIHFVICTSTTGGDIAQKQNSFHHHVFIFILYISQDKHSGSKGDHKVKQREKPETKINRT